MYKRIISTLAILAITGCGSSSSSTSTKTTEEVVGYNGFFVDAAIQNISWACGGQSGTTDTNGKFGTCPTNSKVTFSIGNLILGEASPTDDYIFTVADVVNVDRDDTGNDIVQGIAALLLSMDKDGDSSNGLVITEEAIAALNAQITEKQEFALLKKDASVALIENAVKNNPQVDSVPTREEITAHLIETNGDIIDGTQQAGEEVKAKKDEATS